MQPTTASTAVAFPRAWPRLVRIEHPPGHGPRLYVLGLRIHHGLVAAVALPLTMICNKRILVLLAFAALCEDLHDYPWRLHETAATARQ